MNQFDTEALAQSPNYASRISLSPLQQRDYAPYRIADLSGKTVFDIKPFAGYFSLLAFTGNSALPECVLAQKAIAAAAALFDHKRARLAIVTQDSDPNSPSTAIRAIAQQVEDPEFIAAAAFGAISPAENGTANFRPRWVILSPALRIVRIIPLRQADVAIETFSKLLSRPEEIASHFPPALEQTDVLEPEFCDSLLSECKRVAISPGRHGQEFGPMSDKQTRDQVAMSLERRVLPALGAFFNCSPRKIEHLTFVKRSRCQQTERDLLRIRDRMSIKVAKAFGVLVPLDDLSYSGGNIIFPEFSPRELAIKKGSALVYSCNLLRETSPVAIDSRCYIEALITA